MQDIDLIIQASRKNWDDIAKRHEKWLEMKKIRLKKQIETLQKEIEAFSDGDFIIPPPDCKML